MPSASSGVRTSYSTARVFDSASMSSAVARAEREVVPCRPLGAERVDAGVLHERRERFVQPDAVPPLHRHEVAEPHVRDLVHDRERDLRGFGLRDRVGVDEQRASRGTSRSRGSPSRRTRSRGARRGRASRRDRGCRSTRRRTAARTRRPRVANASRCAAPGTCATRSGMPPTSTGCETSSSPTTNATRYVDILIVSPNSTRTRPSPSDVRSTSGPFESATRPSATTSVIEKTALNSGSSKQGKARRACGASNWVAASMRSVPSRRCRCCGRSRRGRR